ncbi:MAG: diguanylate cyclase, partial [Solirubrobacterales bacterium]|nr:diguanylate cyclase [Solirubrobacterales bacterium]
RDDAVLAQTLRGTAAAGLPDRGTVTLAGDELRVVSFVAPGFRGARLRISLLAQTAVGSPANAVVLEVFLVLLGFLVLAITLALAVSRSLQQQIATVLHGARRLGAGDLTTRVPAEGGDEFAALAGEFNKMAGQLETRLAELHQERARVVRRLGEALGANLDRDALLEIVGKTAVEGVTATAGRTIVVTPGGGLREHQRVGDPTGLQDSLADAEQRALRSGETQELVVGGVHAIAHPLRESDGDRRVVGVISVARDGRGFTDAERELFVYLATQAALSLENVELHETVARESVTDELTRLSNRRRFEGALAEEVERARRFDHPLGLVMVDIDDFKRVNDSYGHQQGDAVLREVARVVRASCRDIDEAARYGGEELAIILPETDLEGTHHLAERVRRGVAALRLEPVAGAGLHITVSCGAAALPESAGDAHDLVAAADAALYEAKRAGKNRTVRVQGGTSAPSAFSWPVS